MKSDERAECKDCTGRKPVSVTDMGSARREHGDGWSERDMESKV